MQQDTNNMAKSMMVGTFIQFLILYHIAQTYGPIRINSVLIINQITRLLEVLKRGVLFRSSCALSSTLMCFYSCQLFPALFRNSLNRLNSLFQLEAGTISTCFKSSPFSHSCGFFVALPNVQDRRPDCSTDSVPIASLSEEGCQYAELLSGLQIKEAMYQ